MPRKDHHQDEYRPTTLTKLNLFEQYLREWLPVFLKSEYYQKANIIDFFAGPGKDRVGVDGSPIRIIKTIREFFGDQNFTNEFKLKEINIILNEAETDKFEQLKYEIKKIQEPILPSLTNLKRNTWIGRENT